jgi:8-oxo-dGTP pyrophosphatase MutT (NUDIX family)
MPAGPPCACANAGPDRSSWSDGGPADATPLSHQGRRRARTVARSMRQCDGAEAKHAGVPLRRVDIAAHLIAVGPDLNLAWHFRCRVALPVIRSTARADERDDFVKSDGTLTTADRHQHDRTDRQGLDRYRKNAHSAHPPRMPDRRSAVSAPPAVPKPARRDDEAWRDGLRSASCWTIKAGSCCSRVSPRRATSSLAGSVPGGGLETGEGYEQAARRELFEETGIVAEELGPVVLERTVRFTWEWRGVRPDRALLRCSYQRAGDLERSVDRRGAPGDRGASVVDGRRAPKRQRTRLSGGAHPFGRIGVAMRRPLASDRNGHLGAGRHPMVLRHWDASRSS